MIAKTFKIGVFQQKLFWLLFSFLLLTLIGYIYLINHLIFNVANREALSQERDQLTLDNSVLESRYLSLTKTITIDRAYALGFEETKADDITFALLAPLHLARR